MGKGFTLVELLVVVLIFLVAALALWPIGSRAIRARLAEGYAQRVALTVSEWALSLPGVSVAQARAAWGVDCRYTSPRRVQGGGGRVFTLRAPPWLEGCTIFYQTPSRVSVEVRAYGQSWRAKSW